MGDAIAELRFPAGGVVKRLAYQHQAPFTTAEALNVRPKECMEGRERGGSRPGLCNAFMTQLGSGNPVRMITTVNYVQEDGLTFWSDSFNAATLGGEWSAASWINASLPSVYTGKYSSVEYNTTRGAVRTALSDMDTTQGYKVGIYIVPYMGAHHGTYKLFARMNNTTPVGTTDGVIATLTMTGTDGSYSGTLVGYNGGTATSYSFSGTLSSVKAGWFTLLCSGTTYVAAWCGTQLSSQTLTLGANAGYRMGFGLDCTVAEGICLADTFRIDYRTNINKQVMRRPVIASANGSVYYESYAGTFETVAGSVNLTNDRHISAAERGQRLYIADTCEPRASGTSGSISAGVLDEAGITWSGGSISIDVNNDVVELISGTFSTGAVGVFNITSVDPTNGITLATTSGVNPATYSATNVSWRVLRGPKIFNPVTNGLSLFSADSGKGFVPAGCPLVCRYRDRLVWAGDPNNPHIWYMSRQGTPGDYNYGADVDDGQRAVGGASAPAGTVGEPIKALIPYQDDYLIFGLENSLWVMRGDPALGGSLDCISQNVGVVGAKSWCHGPNGEVIFLSRDGVYSVVGNAVQSISRERLPRDLINLDSNTYTILLAYDAVNRGVNILITTNSTNVRTQWWFDWDSKGFWPEQLPATMEATSIYEHYAPSGDDSGVLLGCKDGYIRKFSYAVSNDDGTAFNSHVYYGPIKLGSSEYNDGLLVELIGTTAKKMCGDVNWAVHTGVDPETAVESTAFASGTWATAGTNYKERPRARGHCAYVKLSNGQTNTSWAIEKVTGVIKRAGAQRL